MAKFICDSGTVTIPDTDFDGVTATLCVTSVTLDISATTASSHCMGAGEWRERALASKEWTATIEAHLDDTVGADIDGLIGAAIVLTFDTVDGLVYSGAAVVTGININAPVGEFATMTITAEGNGAISENVS